MILKVFQANGGPFDVMYLRPLAYIYYQVYQIWHFSWAFSGL